MMKKRRKIIISLLALFLMALVVGATLNTFFGNVDTDLEVKQAVTIDGKLATEPIKHTLSVWSGDSEEVKHTISNNASVDINITQVTTGLSEGLTLTITYKSNGTEVQFPLVLKGEKKVRLVFTYDTDINLKEKVYKIKTRFSCEEIGE